jgi:hypothetical protein
MSARLNGFLHGGDARLLVVRFSKTVTVRSDPSTLLRTKSLIESLAPCYH